MRPGQQAARVPASPHANLSVTTRAGAKPHGNALWTLACMCGFTTVSESKHIKRGSACCPTCNPPGAEVLAAVLAIMPANYAQIMSRAKLTRSQAEHRVRQMRKLGMCHVGKWKRPAQQGHFIPVFYAGAGTDAPCDLAPRPISEIKRNHEQRVRKAVAVAIAGGKEDPRYLRHIRSKQVTVTVRAMRATPQHPFSALFQAGPTC